MLLYSLIFPIIAIIAIIWFITLFKRGKIALITLILWSILWLFVLLFSIIPDLSMIFAKIFGITRGIDFIIIVVFVVLFYTVLKLYFALEKLQNDMNTIVKELALNNEISLDDEEE